MYSNNAIQLSDDFEFDIGIYFVETCDIDREAAVIPISNEKASYNCFIATYENLVTFGA